MDSKKAEGVCWLVHPGVHTCAGREGILHLWIGGGVGGGGGKGLSAACPNGESLC